MVNTPTSPPASTPRRPRFKHPLAVLVVSAIVIVATGVAAAILLRQDVATNPSAVDPDVVFAQGSDYTAINTAGFATVSIGTSGTSATFAVNGVPGAALVDIDDVLRLTNSHATQAYAVTLSRSAAPNAAITSFVVEVSEGGASTITWDAAASATSSSFTLSAATTLDIDVQTTIADGTAAGTLGSFDMRFSLVPVAA